ncbi:MAG: ferrous iron transporter B [Clostridia bacterium]|nr:ferrous iron transporter B [Clostridia bacterium]
MKRFALVGNPNCGKTTLFNNLTGSTAHTGNWPGVTVDRREGEYKKCPEPVSIVDLPGIYSLSPYTPEEVVSRNFILDEKPDCIINIIDATNLERNLYLTTQVLEIDVPVIIALNMIDEVKKSGDSIDAEKLEKKIGVPVVAISALKGEGTSELMDRAYEVAEQKRDGFTVLEQSKLSHLISDVAIALRGQGIENPLFHAVKLVESDELEVAAHEPLLGMIDDFKSTFEDAVFGADFEALIADGRYKYISKNYSTALTRNNKTDKSKLTKSDKIDRVLTHRIWGIPMFLLILFAIFHLVFSENFLFIGAALGKDWVSLQGTAFEGVFGAGGINSPGAILQGLMEVLMTWITDGVASWLVNSPAWVTGLLCDGILGGLSAVLSFIPQILLLLMLFSILEDTGYMARVAFILDRILRRFGLSGRAFMPMIMGFGCSVPAMINTRTLADENERVATVRVIPFFSCGAKLPILTAISGGIVMTFGVGNADIITYSMYVVGIVTAIIAVILMKTTTMKGDVAPFIMELPNYRLPQFKSLMLLMWDKAKHFIQKAFTIILASTIIIWVVSHFSFDWKFLADNQMNNSILAGFGKLIQPLFTPLGFGSQLNDWGWVFIVSAITGLIAKENVVATFGTLAACIGASMVGSADGIAETALMISASGITIPALIAFIAFNMTTIPCMAAVATAKAEMPNKKKFKWTLVFWISTSYIVGSIIYLVGSWWWTIFIVLAVVSLVIAGIILYNLRGKKKARRQKNIADSTDTDNGNDK